VKIVLLNEFNMYPKLCGEPVPVDRLTVNPTTLFAVGAMVFPAVVAGI
jgi:hypothetical protein